MHRDPGSIIHSDLKAGWSDTWLPGLAPRYDADGEEQRNDEMRGRVRESRKGRPTLFPRLLIHENGIGGGKDTFDFERKAKN